MVSFDLQMHTQVKITWGLMPSLSLCTKDWFFFFFLNGKFEMNAKISALILSVSNIS